MFHTFQLFDFQQVNVSWDDKRNNKMQQTFPITNSLGNLVFFYKFRFIFKQLDIKKLDTKLIISR